MVWAYRVCLYYPQVFLNTVTTLAKHVHNEQTKETEITVRTCVLVFLSWRFCEFDWDVEWNKKRKCKKKKKT